MSLQKKPIEIKIQTGKCVRERDKEGKKVTSRRFMVDDHYRMIRLKKKNKKNVPPMTTKDLEL